VTLAKRSLRFARVGVDGRVLAVERIGDGEGGPNAVRRMSAKCTTWMEEGLAYLYALL
jgi:hypothetical protein